MQVEYYNDINAFTNGERPSRVIPIKNIIAVRGIGDWFIQLIVRNELHQECVYNLKAEKPEIQSVWTSELHRYFSDLMAWEAEQYRVKPRTLPVPDKLSGYFYKLKHKHSTLGSWAYRFFRIDVEQRTLAYYRR